MHVLVSIGLACTLATPALAQPPAAGNPQTPTTQTPRPAAPSAADVTDLKRSLTQKPIVVTATIEAVDYTDRTVVLRMEDGTQQTLKVDESVKKLQNVKAGDVLKITYYASVASNILKKGDPQPAVGTTGAITPTEGATRPSATIAMQTRLAVHVLDVDRAAQAVRIRDTSGHEMSIQVANPALLDKVKPGDDVEVVFTEAALVAVEPGKTPQ